MFGKFHGNAQSTRTSAESIVAPASIARDKNNAKAPSQSHKIEKQRCMLPALPPHEDKCYIVEFVSDRSEPCKQMTPIVHKIQKELKVKVRTINISKNPSFLQLYECVGGNECGNLPFYYNRRTGQAVCGKTDYKNLLTLFVGGASLFRFDPEEEMLMNSQEARGMREQGWKGFMFEKINAKKK